MKRDSIRVRLYGKRISMLWQYWYQIKQRFDVLNAKYDRKIKKWIIPIPCPLCHVYFVHQTSSCGRCPASKFIPNRAYRGFGCQYLMWKILEEKLKDGLLDVELVVQNDDVEMSSGRIAYGKRSKVDMEKCLSAIYSKLSEVEARQK